MMSTALGKLGFELNATAHAVKRISDASTQSKSVVAMVQSSSVLIRLPIEIAIKALDTACDCLKQRGDKYHADATVVVQLFKALAAEGYLLEFAHGGVSLEQISAGVDWLADAGGMPRPGVSSRWDTYTFKDPVTPYR
jgi:hypothetical protein